MTNRPNDSTNGAAETNPDWTTLVGRAVDDVTRILRSEAHMFQTSMGNALEARIANVLATLTMIVAMICGAICILSASILLLHQWLPWWQSFGIAGVASGLIGLASRAIMKPASEIEIN